jgi:hypothetical protein
MFNRNNFQFILTVKDHSPTANAHSQKWFSMQGFDVQRRSSGFAPSCTIFSVMRNRSLAPSFRKARSASRLINS